MARGEGGGGGRDDAQAARGLEVPGNADAQRTTSAPERQRSAAEQQAVQDAQDAVAAGLDLEYISQFLARMLGQPLHDRHSSRLVAQQPKPGAARTLLSRDSDDDEEEAAGPALASASAASTTSAAASLPADVEAELNVQRMSVLREEDKIAARLPRSIAKLTEVDWGFPMEDVQMGKVLSDSGSFSVVRRGTYKGEPVCIKEVKIDDEVYAITEITLLHSLQHDHIIKLLGATFERTDGVTKIVAVTEFMHGGSLTDALKADKSSASLVPWPHRLRICAQIAQALDFLHERGIMHRDIKPDNALLNIKASEMSRVSPDVLVAKLADFGMARGTYSRVEVQEGRELDMRHRARKSTRTRRQTICGTEEFMAPELLFSTPYTASVDVFAFGGLLAEVATGLVMGKKGFIVRKPEDSFQVDFTQIGNAAIKGCPTSLLRLTEQCMCYDAFERLSPADVVEWLEELQIELDSGEAEIHAATATSGARVSSLRKASRPKSKHKSQPGGRPPSGHLGAASGAALASATARQKASLKETPLPKNQARGPTPVQVAKTASIKDVSPNAKAANAANDGGCCLVM